MIDRLIVCWIDWFIYSLIYPTCRLWGCMPSLLMMAGQFYWVLSASWAAFSWSCYRSAPRAQDGSCWTRKGLRNVEKVMCKEISYIKQKIWQNMKMQNWGADDNNYDDDVSYLIMVTVGYSARLMIVIVMMVIVIVIILMKMRKRIWQMVLMIMMIIDWWWRW